VAANSLSSGSYEEGGLERCCCVFVVSVMVSAGTQKSLNHHGETLTMRGGEICFEALSCATRRYAYTGVQGLPLSAARAMALCLP
jgi:hypothetical protein